MTSQKTIHIHYYALLREERGRTRESVETSAATAEELYRQLQKEHRFRFPVDGLRLAINNEFAAWVTPLKDGDTVVFIPPVAGG